MSGNIPFKHECKNYTLSIAETSDDDPAKDQGCPRAVLTLHKLSGDHTFFRQLVFVRNALGYVQDEIGKKGTCYTFLVPAQMKKSSHPQWLVEELDPIVSHLNERNKWRRSSKSPFLIFTIPYGATYVTLRVRGYAKKAGVERWESLLTQSFRTAGLLTEDSSVTRVSTEDCTFRIPPLNKTMIAVLERTLTTLTS